MKILLNLKNNFFFKIKLVTIFIILTPIYTIIFFLRPLIEVRFGNIDITRIGHSLNYELFKLYEKEKKYIIIWFINSPVCNNQLYKIFQRNFFFFQKFHILYDTTQFFSKYFKFLRKIIYEVDLYDYKNFLEKKKIALDLTTDELKYGEEKIKDFGIPKKAKIVCINIRTKDYLKKQFPRKDFSYQDYRNAKVKNFIPIINNLLKKGFYVIRMGKNVKNKINIKHKNFLDYPFSTLKSDFMDLFLIKKCHFFIGSNTGLDCIAIIFRKPLLCLNMLPVSLFYLFKKKILITPKILFRRNKKLRLSQIFDLDIHNCSSFKCYGKKKISIKELSYSQINNCLNEFIKMEKNNWKLNKKEKKVQEKFRKIYLDFIGKEQLHYTKVLNKNNILGYVSNNYIEKNNWC